MEGKVATLSSLRNGQQEKKRKESVPPPSYTEIHRRIHAMVDVGNCFLGFTVEEIDGAHVAMARVFDLNTRAWLPDPIPIHPRDENELPIDGQWNMQLIEYDTILCIYSNPSNCRLIYLHLDRTPPFYFSLFFRNSRDIRPVTSILLDRSLHCSVIYERETNSDGERVSVVTDDYQFDRNSVRVWEVLTCNDGNGVREIVEIGPCNLTDTTEDFIMARSESGDIVMTKGGGEGIVVDRETGNEKRVEIESDPFLQLFPTFRSVSSFVTFGRTFSIDVSGSLWSLDATQLVWRKHVMKPFHNGNISSLTLTCYNRTLCVEHFKRREGDEIFGALPQWGQIQPASLRELAQTCIHDWLTMDEEQMNQVLRGMLSLSRGYDSSIAFVIALLDGKREE